MQDRTREYVLSFARLAGVRDPELMLGALAPSPQTPSPRRGQ
ncbi:hypothetical protein [Streptomyces sp. NPDC005423]